MRVLVTGGAGYIGSHTAKALKASGFEPVVLDDLSTGHQSAVRYGPFVLGSIEDTALVAHTIREHRIEAALHFAGSAYVRESFEQPQKYFKNNVRNSLALVDALMESGVSRIVFSSTCAVFGVPATLPIDEDAPKQPINPYGESKLFFERVLEWYGRIRKLRWVALRYFNAAGADPDGELGELHDPEPHLIPLVIRASLGMGPPISILGTDFRTSDGTAIRDYVHVSDLASAHVRALQYLLDGSPSGAFNLGTGSGRSVLEIIKATEAAIGRNVPVISMPCSPADPPELIANPALAHKKLGWRCERSELESIIDTALRWTRSQR